MILIWSVARDRSSARVETELRALGHNVAFLDQRAFAQTELELRYEARLDGFLRVGSEEIRLADVTGIYLRPRSLRTFRELASKGPGDELWRHAGALEEGLVAWMEIASVPVINRPSATSANDSKPRQLQQLRDFGFTVPTTLVTTDPDVARGFIDRYARVIFKAVSSARTVTTVVDAAALERLEEIATCPTQFQEYIGGVDYRVHVVGPDVFPCRIVSDADDYRQAEQQGAPVEFQASSIPDELANLCCRAAQSAGLQVAGLDFRVTPEGVWYCFEMNTTPDFAGYEEATQHPIAAAIARLLVGQQWPARTASERGAAHSP